MKDNPTMNNFFQGMSYTSFQKLADAYLEKEARPTSKPLTVSPTAPELVKLAFMLDFTARIAGLSRQNLSHITCLGNRYLQDRFEYKQVKTEDITTTYLKTAVCTIQIQFFQIECYLNTVFKKKRHQDAKHKTLLLSFAGMHRSPMVGL